MEIAHFSVARPHLYPQDYERLGPQIFQILDKLPLEGRLIIDVDSVRLTSTLFLNQMVQWFLERNSPKKWKCQGMRFIVLKNPNAEVCSTASLCLAGTNCSVLTIYSSPDRDTPAEDIFNVINLPRVLKSTWEFILANDRISSRELTSELPQLESTNVKERLRQLFRQGLILRTPIEDPETGRVTFLYSVKQLFEALSGKRGE